MRECALNTLNGDDMTNDTITEPHTTQPIAHADPKLQTDEANASVPPVVTDDERARVIRMLQDPEYYGRPSARIAKMCRVPVAIVSRFRAELQAGRLPVAKSSAE